LSRILADRAAHWGLRQEAAGDLGTIGDEVAGAALRKALGDPDRRVRRAAALALGQSGLQASAPALRQAAESDTAEDVAAAAEISLGRLGAAGTKEFLTRQLSHDSRYWDSIRIGALTGLGKLEDASLAAVFDSYADPKYRQEVRLAALDGWGKAAPGDPRLAERLRQFTSDRNRNVRQEAIHRLGELHHESDLPLFQKLALDPDPSIAEFARESIEEIEAFVRVP
jgi:HEAT repeat protein